MRGFGPHGGMGGFGGPHGGFGGPRLFGPMMGPGFGPRGMMFGGPFYGGYRYRRFYGRDYCCSIF